VPDGDGLAFAYVKLSGEGFFEAFDPVGFDVGVAQEERAVGAVWLKGIGW
jgi:hypothetical protein